MVYFFFVVATYFFLMVSSKTTGPNVEQNDDLKTSQTHIQNILENSNQIYSGNGFNDGSGLRTIAQGSAEQAHNAVASQHIAANQAAFIAKSTLAQAAAGASATAQAALVGKYVLLSKLEQEVQEAHSSLQSEVRQLELAQRAVLSAHETFTQALYQVKVLTVALNSAQATASHAVKANDGAAAELASQTAMVSKARQKLALITQQLHAAQIDFGATENAAKRAAAAAQLAQTNAVQAGAAASLNHVNSNGIVSIDVVNSLSKEH